MINIIILIMFT